MSEIKITTTGDLFLFGDLVGWITFLKPFVESDVAGEFQKDAYWVDEWGARIDCTACEKKGGALDELEGDVAKLRKRLKAKAQTVQDTEWTKEQLSALFTEIDIALQHMDFAYD